MSYQTALSAIHRTYKQVRFLLLAPPKKAR
uniref:Uncharacterized protein n=1 Tax=Ackermannviridae sp. TaxID=2831612 RepID=A0A8S5RVA6_9CAUD|nr:MAG TPA: hypothetical protein [Ackermannviridae sp.]